MSKAKDTCKKYNYNPGVVDGIIDAMEERIGEYEKRIADMGEKILGLGRVIQTFNPLKETGHVPELAEGTKEVAREPAPVVNTKQVVEEVGDEE